MAGYFGWKTILVITRELVGGSYAQSALVCLAIALWLVRRFSTPRAPADIKHDPAFWLLIVIVPLLSPIWADVHFQYFLANRQWIFALPGLAYMAGKGLEVTKSRYRPVVFASLVLSLTVADIRWFTKAREDWSTAANLLVRAEVQCIVYFPLGSERFYAFFQPALRNPVCDANSDRAILAVAPYGNSSAPVSIYASGHQFRKSQTLYGGEPRLVEYKRF